MSFEKGPYFDNDPIRLASDDVWRGFVALYNGMMMADMQRELQRRANNNGAIDDEAALRSAERIVGLMTAAVNAYAISSMESGTTVEA